MLEYVIMRPDGSFNSKQNLFFRDKKGQTPYVVAPEKDTRNTFRKYMAEHPHKYDYTKAQVDKFILF